MKFPLMILRRKKFAAHVRLIRREAHDEAIVEIIELLRKKDKIFLEPVTIVGSNQTITNCVFLGTGLRVKEK